MKKAIVWILAMVLLLGVCGCRRGSKGAGSQDASGVPSASSAPTYRGGVPGLATDASGTESTGTQESTQGTDPVGTGGHSPQSTAATTKASGQTATPTVSRPGSAPAVAANKSYTFKTPLLPGDKARQKLSVNPNRGFRLENYMNVENGKYTPEMYDSNGSYKGRDANASMATGWMMKFYSDYDYEAPQVIQTYFYLTQYRDKDLDQTAINHMNEYFQACRSMNMTIALRFAYVFVYERRDEQDCVSLEQMLRHMEQLKPVLAKNRDVLFCLEGGFYGEWGEQSGGSSWYQRGLSGTIIDHAVKMVPDDLWVVMRYYDGWSKTSAASKKRLGFHNDYICGFSHVWDTGGRWDTEAYQHTKLLSETVLFEGEMPWGSQLPNNLKNLNGWNVVKYLYDNHYTVLSCYHNNREGGSTYDMKKWRSVTVTPKLLKEHGMRYYDEWFKTAQGKEVYHSLFDYLQQFLGYHIAASDVQAKKAGTKAEVSLRLTNYGFAAPLALKAVRLVILNGSDKIVDSKKLCELVDLQAGTTLDLKASMTLPKSDQVYRVGLFLESHSAVGARLANDVDLAGQVNVLGTMN